MHSTFYPAGALAFAFVFSATHARVIIARDGNENVALANCKNGNGGLSSQMAYFSGAVGGSPGAIAVVQTGSTVVWEGNTVSGTFADGNVFTSQIVSPKVVAGAYAGPGNNNYGGFYCYLNYQAGAYTDSNGNTCDMIYDCNHIAPTMPNPPSTTSSAPAQGTARFDFTVDGSYVTMAGHYAASDMLSVVDQVIGDEYCDSTKSIPIGDGTCSISFSCHGDVPHDTTYGMATMLKSIVSQQPGLVNYYTQKVKTCTDTNPEVKPGQNPCIYTWVPQDFTQINSNLQMNVVYVPANNPSGATDQGQLTYSITCQSPGGPNCNFCKGFSTGLEGAAVLSAAQVELATFFAGLQFATDATCAIIGC